MDAPLLAPATHCQTTLFDVRGECLRFKYGDALRLSRGVFGVADESEPVVRKPRADAERNRIRLLETAKVAFAKKGSRASLDEIARTAGVGAGTLYRHFP